jgi:hypothetical protein
LLLDRYTKLQNGAIQIPSCAAAEEEEEEEEVTRTPLDLSLSLSLSLSQSRSQIPNKTLCTYAASSQKNLESIHSSTTHPTTTTKTKTISEFQRLNSKKTQNAAAEQERETHIPQDSETDPRDDNSSRAKKEEDHPPLSRLSPLPDPDPPCASAIGRINTSTRKRTHQNTKNCCKTHTHTHTQNQTIFFVFFFWVLVFGPLFVSVGKD